MCVVGRGGAGLKCHGLGSSHCVCVCVCCWAGGLKGHGEKKVLDGKKQKDQRKRRCRRRRLGEEASKGVS